MHYGEKVVVVRRSAEPFRNVADIESTIESVLRALPIERRKGHAVIVDTRLSPIRPDPALEPAFARYRVEVERGFDRVVVVVSTVVGRIRSGRLGQVTQVPFTVVGTLDEAWTLLRGAVS